MYSVTEDAQGMTLIIMGAKKMDLPSKVVHTLCLESLGLSWSKLASYLWIKDAI